MVTQFDHGYALIVGVGGDLPVTEADARALDALLRNPQKAAYPDQQVKLLAATESTRGRILQELDWLAACAQKDPLATVIVYYSGHGRRIVSKARNVLGYTLVPHGFTTQDLKGTGLTGEELTAKINAIRPNKLLVLLDCCHAGGLPSASGGSEEYEETHIPFELEKVAAGGGRVVVASSRANETSLTGNPNSIFTQCLLEALSGHGARLADGKARILEVLSYLYERVPKLAETWNKDQHVFVNKITDLGDNFPLCYFTPGAYDNGLSLLAEGLSAGNEPLTSAQQERLVALHKGYQDEFFILHEEILGLRNTLHNAAISAVTRLGLEQDLSTADIRLASLAYHLRLMEKRLGSNVPTYVDLDSQAKNKAERAEQELLISQERLASPGASDRQLAEANAQQQQAKIELDAVADENLRRSLLRLNYFDQSLTFERFKRKNTRRGAFLIRGQPFFGQKWLLTRLLEEAGSNGFPAASLGKHIQTVPIVINLASLIKQNSLEEVWATLAGEAGLDSFPLPPIMDILKGLLRRWETQDVVIILDDINKFTPEILNPLLNEIWPPLAAAPLPANDRRLLLFMLDQENVTQAWAQQLNFVQDIGQDWMPSLPIHLPEITAVDSHELGSWFQHHFNSLPKELADKYIMEADLVKKVLTDTQGAPIKVLMMICHLCGRKWKEKEKAWMIY